MGTRAMEGLPKENLAQRKCLGYDEMTIVGEGADAHPVIGNHTVAEAPKTYIADRDSGLAAALMADLH